MLMYGWAWHLVRAPSDDQPKPPRHCGHEMSVPSLVVHDAGRRSRQVLDKRLRRVVLGTCQTTVLKHKNTKGDLIPVLLCRASCRSEQESLYSCYNQVG